MNASPDGKKMGLFMATMLVTVNMVGTGIFLLPVSMASVGSISTWGWLVATIGAGAIGLMYAQLGNLDPRAGGPYAYARSTLGPYLGFQTNYVYWTANLLGNIAVATTVTGYFTEFIPALKIPGVGVATSILWVWLATGINIVGPRLVGTFAAICTVLAAVPLLMIGGLGWFWFDPELFKASWNPTDISEFDAISKSAALAFWAFIGVESASVSAGVIENPKKNVARATILGLVISAVLYISICTVLMGVIPVSELAKSDAPLAIAVAKAVGPVGGVIIAICAILKSFAALTGWTMTISQSAQAAAEDGMFPRFFRKINSKGVPMMNLLFAAVLMSLIVILTASGTLASQFNAIIDMAILLTLIPYLYTVVAFLKTSREAGGTGVRTFVIPIIAGIACLYCLWAIGGSDANLVRNSMIVLFLSVPFYTFFAKGLERRK